MNQSIWADPAPPSEEKQPNAVLTPSSLSAAAPQFAPEVSPQPLDPSVIDEFAQTGAQQDDLFDDVEPVESMRIRSDDDLFSDDFTPATQSMVEQLEPPQSQSHSDRGRGKGRGRGRGLRENRSQHNRSDASKDISSSGSGTRSRSKQQTQVLLQPSPPENAPTGPRKEVVSVAKRDRQATGGLAKPKLTDEELAEKMAKIQIKNVSLEAAHARAEADAASFAEREQQAKQATEQRKREERRDRQQMMGEREKNRQRKLKAMEGREWDAEKQEDDFSKGGRFDKHGNFAGDKEGYSDGREYLYREPRGGEKGRGSAGPGRGGPPVKAAAPPRQEDFPALQSTANATLSRSAQGPAEATKPSSKSWADQVEAAPTI